MRASSVVAGALCIAAILTPRQTLLAAWTAPSPAVTPEATPIEPNDNTRPAGQLRDGVLTVRIEARSGLWRPQADDGDGVVVHAFAEGGASLRNPGPLIRVRAGTRVEARVRNGLADTLVAYGLHTRPGTGAEHVVVAPGATAAVTFDAGAPGTYYYWGNTTGADMETRLGVDSQLHGAFIVDPATGPMPDDRIFVMGNWFQPADESGPEPHEERDIMTINGKSWPHTERIHLTVGDSVRWRWLNPTPNSHPMHLHGFYFRVDSRGGWAADTTYAPAQRRLVVTELMLPGGTVDTRWVPEREGNWLFHCHFAFHMSDELYLASTATGAGKGEAVAASGHGADHPATNQGMDHGMAGLVLGIHVSPNPELSTEPEPTGPLRRIRLLAQQRSDPSHARHHVGYVVAEGDTEPSADSIQVPGPLLVLQRGQPVAITVVNRLDEPTAVHWHGIELESFPDGVPGWSGTPGRIMPPIAPGDSFIAEFVPPRAGTFMYHSHFAELYQILGGLFGPLVVLEPGEEFDPERDHIFTMGVAGAEFPGAAQLGTINGSRTPPDLHLTAGTPYRFRFINIGDFRTFASLLDGGRFVPARPLAKDGADLPDTQRALGPLNHLTGPGETADYEVVLEPGVYRLEFKTQQSGWIVPVRIHVRAP
jgi:manganese oxidase